MRTAEDLRRDWEHNEELRLQWKSITESTAWKVVSELVAAEFTEQARNFKSVDFDVLLARKLQELDAAHRTIQSLQSRWYIPKKEEETAELEPYSDEYVKKFIEQKEQKDQQQS